MLQLLAVMSDLSGDANAFSGVAAREAASVENAARNRLHIAQMEAANRNRLRTSVATHAIRSGR